MKVPKAIKNWQICVQAAKRKLKIPKNTYVPVKGELLKVARKIYCLMGY